MSTFIFKEILLASFREKKARRVRFDPKVTIVRGNNETGKSSLIKSIFRTFGAEPVKVHENWVDADVRSVIRFEVNGEPFAILRHGNSYAGFDGQDKLTGRFSSVTNDLAPFLSRILDFGLRLPNREGANIALPPAYYFLPFYMDQDSSWANQWSGFARLEQFPNWKRGVVEYHAGIRGNEFYEAQATKLEAEGKLNMVRRRLEGFQDVYQRLSEKFIAAQFNPDFTVYKADVEEVLKQCDLLRTREETYKARITELRDHRQSLKTQLDITIHAREESRRDYDYANACTEDEVPCPTCGAHYSNSFAERFSIAVDEDHCAGLALKLTDELADVDAKIANELKNSEKVTEELGSIERLLARREGEIALGDLIRQEGRRELRDFMTKDIQELEDEEGRQLAVIDSVQKQMKQLTRKGRQDEVNRFYEEKMHFFLNELDVHSVPDKSTTNVNATIKDTGSELPRALLAYQMAFLHVVAKFGSATLAPLVIDSPNQQDQDDRHLARVLRFIKDQRPSDSQLVLALVDTAGVDFEGTEILLDRKYSLLLESEFDEVGGEVQRLVDAALEG